MPVTEEEEVDQPEEMEAVPEDAEAENVKDPPLTRIQRMERELMAHKGEDEVAAVEEPQDDVVPAEDDAVGAEEDAAPAEEDTAPAEEDVDPAEEDAAEEKQQEEEEGEEEKVEKMYKFPLGRVKNIMKLDPDTNMASMDAVFLISKATELFIASLAAESFSYTSKNKKKTIMRHDVDAAIDGVDSLAFLDGAIQD